jgi:hypothetical protein
VDHKSGDTTISLIAFIVETEHQYRPRNGMPEKILAGVAFEVLRQLDHFIMIEECPDNASNQDECGEEACQ